MQIIYYPALILVAASQFPLIYDVTRAVRPMAVYRLYCHSVKCSTGVELDSNLNDVSGQTLTSLDQFTLINIPTSSSEGSHRQWPIGPNKLYVVVNQTTRSTIFLHDKMLKLSKTKKRVTLSHHTRHATLANALIKTCF